MRSCETTTQSLTPIDDRPHAPRGVSDLRFYRLTELRNTRVSARAAPRARHAINGNRGRRRCLTWRSRRDHLGLGRARARAQRPIKSEESNEFHAFESGVAG